MQKPPTTLLIARSNYQAVCHAALAAGLAGVLSLIVSWWVMAGCALLLMWVVIYQYKAQPVGELLLKQSGTRLVGRWLLNNGELGEERPIHCDYMGPWLLGMYVGSQRVWLWPDSLSAHSHRALRRLCHHPGR